MTDSFNPIEELRLNGLYGNSVPPATEQILSTLTKPQVDVLVQVKQRVETARLGGQPSSSDQARLASAMMAAIQWDRPSMALVDAEVEGMSVSPAESACLCACTGGGGGGGA